MIAGTGLGEGLLGAGGYYNRKGALGQGEGVKAP